MDRYYICKFILDKMIYYCLWHSDTDDFFKINEDIVYCNSVEDIKKIIKNENLIVGEEIAEYDCEKIEKFSKNNILSPNEILNFWNILMDLSKSLKVNFIGNDRTKKIDKIYAKLFYGCNLPAITPENEEYIPVWTKKEIRKIKEIIENGLFILRNVFILK